MAMPNPHVLTVGSQEIMPKTEKSQGGSRSMLWGDMRVTKRSAHVLQGVTSLGLGKLRCVRLEKEWGAGR